MIQSSTWANKTNLSFKRGSHSCALNLGELLTSQPPITAPPLHHRRCGNTQAIPHIWVHLHRLEAASRIDKLLPQSALFLLTLCIVAVRVLQRSTVHVMRSAATSMLPASQLQAGISYCSALLCMRRCTP